MIHFLSRQKTNDHLTSRSKFIHTFICLVMWFMLLFMLHSHPLSKIFEKAKNEKSFSLGIFAFNSNRINIINKPKNTFRNWDLFFINKITYSLKKWILDGWKILVIESFANLIFTFGENYWCNSRWVIELFGNLVN